MSIADAVKVTEAQLAYWEHECETARRTNDVERMARCEKFIAQCELVLSALKEAQQSPDKV